MKEVWIFNPTKPATLGFLANDSVLNFADFALLALSHARTLLVITSLKIQILAGS